MREQWTGDLIGQLHVAGITCKALAKEAGLHEKYVSQILNGRVHPKGAQEKLFAAFGRIRDKEEV